MVNDEWSRPTAEQLAHAKSQALLALQPERCAWRLRRYYRTAGDFAGASFVSIGTKDPGAITADDLFAVTLLSVSIPAGAARLLTESGETKDAVTESLRALPTRSLPDVDDRGLRDMETFYGHVKNALARAGSAHSNPWVTASKLCARKRPDLFPVRDNVVCALLGLLPNGNYRVDWQVFQHLMRDADVVKAVEAAREAAMRDADEGQVVMDEEPLRVLDAALWSSVTMPDPVEAPA